MKPRLLLVDDQDAVRFGMADFLGQRGYEVVEAASLAQASEALQQHSFAAAVLDYFLPDGNALALLAELKESPNRLPVVILTAHGSIDLAVAAIREGAEHFLTKPVELATLAVILERAIESQRNRQKTIAVLTSPLKRPLDPFIGTSPAILELKAQAHRLMASESPILIQGETGSGKGVLAHWLHRHGPRGEEAFVDLNCAGLSRELLESELFGHAKGAFTGAASAKPGLLEAAHRGTVFLDEIADLDLTVQPKLLKVLEDKRFRRLGDVRDRTVDIRLVSASHWDLGELVRRRVFRSDLYYRLAAIPLVIPPLRQRTEDLPVVVEAVLERLRSELGRTEAELTPEGLNALAAYSWPGNLRELRNVLERAILLAEGPRLGPRDLRFLPLEGPRSVAIDSQLTLEEMERQLIEQVLNEETWRVPRAAARLKVPRSTLYEKIKRYGLARE